tara:strand:+ start:329 stop:697 length:369 start_codon:yes stop_codon:yes gene_type:complete
MDTFRFLLFGIAGVSLIFWVSVIALWHTYMFPTFFKEDKDLDSFIVDDKPNTLEPILGDLVKINTLKSREKYSMKNFVIADFSSFKKDFKLNKLYTTVMIGVSFATFMFITYGLSSSITTVN